MASGKSDLARTADLLNSAAIHLLRSLAGVDRESGLTPARLSALSVVVFGGPCLIGQLAQAEGVTAPTMSRVVDGLAELGLVKRAANPLDSRGVLVAATEAGTHLMYAARQRRLDAIRAALRRLGLAERRALVGAAPALASLARVASETASEPSAANAARRRQ
ncbi:MAG TPA: MarR family transcriptional regulator [Dermatophilaceae bacterium]|nr:MarR family transcriptional regulator [Dermatophilaceae bacterium]